MRPIHVVSVGDFGRAVASSMQAYFPDALTTHLDRGPLLSNMLPLARVHVLAAWRPVPAMAAELDGVAFAWKVPWLPVVYEHPYVRIGPLVVPGKGPCYTCFRNRLKQHSSRAELIEAVSAAYDRDPELGPKGFFPPMARLAAAAAAEVLRELDRSPEREAGVVRQINVLYGRAQKHHVVGVHGCPRCGLQRDERTRSYEALLADVTRLLPAGAAGRRG